LDAGLASAWESAFEEQRNEKSRERLWGEVG
jgi:hypothetical protein